MDAGPPGVETAAVARRRESAVADQCRVEVLDQRRLRETAVRTVLLHLVDEIRMDSSHVRSV